MLRRTCDTEDMNLHSHERVDYIHNMRQNLMIQLTDRMHNNH